MLGRNDTVDPMESVKQRYMDGLKQLVKDHVLTAAEIPGMMRKSDEDWAAVERSQKRQDEIARQETMSKYEAGRRPFVITGTRTAPAVSRVIEPGLNAALSPTNNMTNVHPEIDRKNDQSQVFNKDAKNDQSNVHPEIDVKQQSGNVQRMLEKSRIPGL
jgi:hypothetical protein